MAFTLQAIVGTSTYTLNNGSPFYLERAEGMGLANVRRLSERGPFQHGATDLGYRLDPRTITLSFNFAGTSASALDGHRDTLASIFKPLTSTPIQLKVTRDDGSVRQIDCYAAGPADIPLVPLNRPGNLHRAVVQLRAPDPLWYDPTPGTTTFTGVVSYDWWTANNTVGTANVLEYVGTPALDQAWTYAGTVTGDWTVAFRSGKETGNDSFTEYAFSAYSGNFSVFGTASNYSVNGVSIGTAAMAAGTHNYIVVYRDASPNGTAILYRGTAAVGTISSGQDDLRGPVGKWRTGDGGTAWSEPLIRAAAYDIALSEAQRAALNTAMTNGDVAGSAFVVELGTVAYSGDFAEYPVITITGPITDPIVANVTTGETLNFTGGSIGAATTRTIDLRYGYKTVKDGGGDNKIAELTSASDLATWHLAPNPTAAGGTNVLQVDGTAIGTATTVQVVYYKRYMSF